MSAALSVLFPRAEMAALLGAKTVWLPICNCINSSVGAAVVRAPARPVRPAPVRACRAPAAYCEELEDIPEAVEDVIPAVEVAVAEPMEPMAPEVAAAAEPEAVAAAAVSLATEALRAAGSWEEMVEAAAAKAPERALLADSVAAAGKPDAGEVRPCQ